MSPAITKTISLLLLIIIGYFFRKKIKSRDHLEGLKTVILGLALPATIFIALLQIEFEPDLIAIPVLALAFNFLVYFLIGRLPLRPLFHIPMNQYRTLILLLPSLAPGLSCFPFIIEYSGQGPLAMAALADVGNKVFVLIVSYMIAMQWYYQTNRQTAPNRKKKLKDLLLSLVNEPVNMVIAIAGVMLSLGINYTHFPDAVSLSIDRLSMLMTPLILIFIGLSMRLTWSQVKTIFSFLFFRSGVAFLISGVILYLLPVRDLATTMLIIVFPQSACSFWPYAHMAAVSKMETQSDTLKDKTFDLDFAMNVLACSMPFSVVLIMSIYVAGESFAGVRPLFFAAFAFISIATVIVLAAGRKWSLMRKQKQLPENLENAEKTVSSHA